jgi:hypothetical protein
VGFKPISLSDTTSYIDISDSAVDKERLIDKQIETDPELKDPDLSDDRKRVVAWKCFQIDFMAAVKKRPAASKELLLFKDGETPTEFVIGVVPAGDMNRIYDETTETDKYRGSGNERFWRMFLHGLRDIKNWHGDVKKKSVNNINYVDTGWLEKNFVGGLRTTAINVGTAIHWFNELTGDEIKN